MTDADFDSFQDTVRPRPPNPLRWAGNFIWSVERAFERTQTSGRAVDDTRLRIFLFLALFGCVFLFLAGEATKAALFSGLGPDDSDRPVSPEARADLVDRNGQILAVDLTHYGVYIDPKQIWDAGETRSGLVAAIPRFSPERFDKVVKAGRRQFVFGGLTPEERAKVHDLGLPGVSFEEEPARVYPLGTSAAHLIGFTDAGGKGLAGAERAFDKDIHAAAAEGKPVQLSVDLRVQAALQDEVAKAAAKFGTVYAMGVVANVRTGEILGMTSWPDYDPNAVSKYPIPNLTNREAASVYELGSVFKAFTIGMALNEGVVNMQSTFDVHAPLMMGGHLIHDFDKGDSTLQLWQVFTHSSNIGASKIALQAGPDRLFGYFKKFGLFDKAPSELFESARPIVPKDRSDTTLTHMAFGQAISVSPLSLATGYTSLMNGGRYIPLTLKKAQAGATPAGRRVISEATSRQMLQLMRLNVTDPKGSGHKADAAGLRVGGKTGSAQKPEHGHYGHNNVSSFAAVFPTDGTFKDDRYLVLITLDSPHATKDTFGFITAGFNAAPTAGAVIDRIGPMLGVKRIAATPFAPPVPQPMLSAAE